MKAHLTVFVLSAILIAGIGMSPAFGQVQEPVTVATDKKSYSDGEKITLTGEVVDLYGVPVTLKVTDARGNVVGMGQITVGADKKYSHELVAGGLMKSPGTYTITVQYGNEKRTATTSFEFAGSTGAPPAIKDVKSPSVTDTTVSITGTDDLIGYEIIGGKLLSVTPDPDSNSLILRIEATDDGSIKLTIPRTIFESQTNGTDSEVFVLIDDEQGDVEETATETSRTLTIEFPAGTEQIEIIGTWVIPEFGAIAAMILAVAIIAIIAVSAKSRLSIMPRY